MHSKRVFKHFLPHADRRNFFLALLWCGGLLTGVLLCTHAPYDSASILYKTMYSTPSMLGLFLVSVLPVAFSAVAVYAPQFPFSHVLVSLSAVTRGFCGTTIYMAVGSAAWIVRPIMLFTASCTSVIMWWLLLLHSAGRRTSKPTCLALCLCCIVYIIDLFLISPFIGDLTKVL